MGFKVTLRKNGKHVGQSHYTSEAVAVGMAKKMNAAGGVQATVERCNGACGMKANRRRRRNGTTGTTFWQAPSREATMRGIEMGDIPGPFSLHAAGGYPSVDDVRGRTVASFPPEAMKAAQLFVSRANALTPRRRNPAKKPKPVIAPDATESYSGGLSYYAAKPKRTLVKRLMHAGTMVQPGYEYRGYYIVQEFTPDSYVAAEKNLSKPLVPRAGTHWTVLHRSGLSIGGAPTLTGAKGLITAIRSTPGGVTMADADAKEAGHYGAEIMGAMQKRPLVRNRRARNGTTAGNMAASRSMTRQFDLFSNRKK